MNAAPRSAVAPISAVSAARSSIVPVGLAGLAYSEVFAFALCAVFVAGFGVTLHNVTANALIQTIVPDVLRGRLISVFYALRLGLDALGGLIAGFVCFGGVLLKQRFDYDDSLDAFGIHGVGGALGAVLTGVFAASRSRARTQCRCCGRLKGRMAQNSSPPRR